jgi:hypothetical protein
MTGPLIAIVKGFAPLVLVSGVCAGLLALYRVATADQFIAACLAAVILVLAALVAPTFIHARDDGDDADAHMEPLRQPGHAEKKLARDLRRRRMLLRGQPAQRGRHAAGAPRPEAPTEVLPALPAEPQRLDPELHAPTEPVAVRPDAAARPDTMYEDWPTGQFAIDVAVLAGGRPGDAA